MRSTSAILVLTVLDNVLHIVLRVLRVLNVLKGIVKGARVANVSGRIVLPIYLSMVGNLLPTRFSVLNFALPPLCAASISRKEAEV